MLRGARCLSCAYARKKTGYRLADGLARLLWSGGNHLPLLWKPFSSHRSAMFRMATELRFEAVTQDQRLINALEVGLANENHKSRWIADDLDLGFVPERWSKLIRHSHGLGNPTNRRMLEVCVFSRLSGDLRSGDIVATGLLTAYWVSGWPDLVVGLAITLVNTDAAREVREAARGEAAS